MTAGRTANVGATNRRATPIATALPTLALAFAFLLGLAACGGDGSSETPASGAGGTQSGSAGSASATGGAGEGATSATAGTGASSATGSASTGATGRSGAGGSDGGGTRAGTLGAGGGAPGPAGAGGAFGAGGTPGAGGGGASDAALDARGGGSGNAGQTDASVDASADAARGDAGSSSLRIITFNIRYANPGDGANAWPNRRELAYRVFRDANADAGGIQEALFTQIQDLAAALPDYRRIGVGRDDGVNAGEFSAILYRFARFDVESSGTFWFSDTPEVPGSIGWGNTTTRICTWAHLVEKGTGHAFYQFNVHLDNVSQPSREKSVQLLMKRVSERRVAADPFIVTGDFNAGEGDVAIGYMKGTAAIGGMANPIPLVDSFRQTSPAATDLLTYHAFVGGTSGAKIDFIFMGPNERATAAEIVRTQENGRYPSDHYPVTATLEMPGW